MKRVLSFTLTAALALSLAVPVLAAEESPFADVPPDHWAAGAIRQAYDENIISGIPAGGVRPRRSPHPRTVRRHRGPGFLLAGDGTGSGWAPS